jgi:branched-chain amino acid transport system substrate-binding protein
MLTHHGRNAPWRCYATALFLGFYVIGSVLVGTTASASQPDPYVIYAIVSATGPAAFVGKSYTHTLRAAEVEVNRTGGIKGRSIRFEIEDDQSNPATTVQLATEIANKHMPVLMGPAIASTCAAIVPVVKVGPATFCFSPQFYPIADSFTFGGGVGAGPQAALVLQFMRNHGWHRLAMLNTTDATGHDGEEHTLETLQLPQNRAFFQLVANEHFNGSDISVSAQIARIKAAGADALLEWSAGSSFGTLMHGVSDGGLDIPLIASGGNANNDTIQQFQPLFPKQTYFLAYLSVTPSVVAAGPIKNEQKKFYAALHAVGGELDAANGSAWDLISVMLDALRNRGLDASPKDIRDYVNQLHGFVGVNGLYDFRDGSQRGSSIQSLLLISWDSATKTWVPASGRAGALLPTDRATR